MKSESDRSLHRSTIYRRLNVDDDDSVPFSSPQLRIKGGREEGKGEKKRKKRNVGGKFANGFYPIPFNEGLSTEEREIDIDLRLCKLPILVHYSLWSSTRARCYKGGCGLFNNVVAACRIIFWYHPAWIGDSIEIDELLIGRSGSSHKITRVNRENSSRSRFNSVIDKSIRLNL